MHDPRAPHAPQSAHSILAERLRTVHDALRAELDALVERGGHVTPFVDLLLGHHDKEERALFPLLRAHGRLRSTDVAFLDARAREHVEVHRACDALIAEPRRVSQVAAELRAILVPHLEAEEAVLTPEHLARMIDAEALAAAMGGPPIR